MDQDSIKMRICDSFVKEKNAGFQKCKFFNKTQRFFFLTQKNDFDFDETFFLPNQPFSSIKTGIRKSPFHFDFYKP